MKEIEKYIGYYLLVYLVVLGICGFFQYMLVCQGKSFLCAVTSKGVLDILTVTAYVLTPIMAIIGFQSWKAQKQYDLEKQLSVEILENINEIRTFLHSNYHQLSAPKKLDEKSFSYNDQGAFNLLEKQYLISAKFKILQEILNIIQLPNNLLKNFEDETLLFIKAIDIAQNANDNKNNQIGVQIINSEQVITKKLSITLPEYKLRFDHSYKKITQELIKMIKPH